MHEQTSRRAEPRPRGARRDFSLPLGRVGGIPIRLSLSWLLSVLIIAFLATPVVQQAIPGVKAGRDLLVGLGLGILLGVSVLLHELGHCLAARAMGVPVIGVRLYLLGGVSELGRLPDTPREEAVIAGAGPGVSALLAAIFGLLIGSSTPHTVTWLLLVELALANLVVAIFNILPALPLDGGRVLRAGVWGVSGRRRIGTFAAVIGGYVIALALLVWGVVEIADTTRVGLLQGGVAVAMALFIGIGAASERHSDKAVHWPTDPTIAALARAVVRLPTETPIALAHQAAAGRAVILTGAEGLAVGLMDDGAAIELARKQPNAPATAVARPIGPDMLILPDERIDGLADRLLTVPPPRFLLIDEGGEPVGVVLATDIARILTRRRGT